MTKAPTATQTAKKAESAQAVPNRAAVRKESLSVSSGWQDLNLQQPAPKALIGAASGGNSRTDAIVTSQNDSESDHVIPATSEVNRNGFVANEFEPETTCSWR